MISDQIIMIIVMIKLILRMIMVNNSNYNDSDDDEAHSDDKEWNRTVFSRSWYETKLIHWSCWCCCNLLYLLFYILTVLQTVYTLLLIMLIYLLHSCLYSVNAFALTVHLSTSNIYYFITPVILFYTYLMSFVEGELRDLRVSLPTTASL